MPVATVAATASRPTPAALGAVVPAGPEPMTAGPDQPAPGASVWSTVFRHVRYENLVAGVSGGVLSNLALHPLDLVKIRFAGKSPRGLQAPNPCRLPPNGVIKVQEGGLGLPCSFQITGERGSCSQPGLTGELGGRKKGPDQGI